MEYFCTHSSGTRTLNTSHETAPVGVPRLECPPLSKTRSQVNTSRRQGSFQIKRTYDPYINEERFREKRRRAAKKHKSALVIQKVYRGYRVRKWFHNHKDAIRIVNRALKAGKFALRVRAGQHRKTMKAVFCQWQQAIAGKGPVRSTVEISENQLNRLITTQKKLQGEEDQSFNLLSPRAESETPRVGRSRTTYADVLTSLVQQIEVSEERASAGQRKLLRETIVRESLRAGGNSFRGGKESLVNSFADFEEINMSRFDFMENETDMPEVISLGMNLDQVSKEALLARIQRLELTICNSSMQLLDELEAREGLLQTRDEHQRTIQKLLDEINSKPAKRSVISRLFRW